MLWRMDKLHNRRDSAKNLEASMIETNTIEVDGSPMNMLVGAPDEAGRYPGILLSHHQGGLDDFTRLTAKGLVREGFVVVAPDHYHHTPKEPDLAAKKAALRDARMIADMQAATNYLRAHAKVLPEATAIMGHCMGGRGTLLGASSTSGFRAAAVFYGGGVMMARGDGPTVFERLGGIRCPVAGFFGAEDNNPSPADARKIEAELARHGVACSFRIYDATGHGFMNPDNITKYRETSARDAWSRSIEFLKAHFAQAAHAAE
jgi:carboxymethylenebutenolidase